MTEREALLKAVQSSADDVTLLRIVADWLEEHGEMSGAKRIRDLLDAKPTMAIDHAGITLGVDFMHPARGSTNTGS